jgi:cytochrome c
VCVFRRALTLGVAALCLVAAAQEQPSRQSVWDGVYTDDQARRGESQYGRNCEACHGADLSGDPVKEVPSLVFDAFLTQWGDRTVKDLFDAVKRSMPRDNPGGLNARAYVDVIAYILQSNKIPSGMRELSLNPDALGQIVIEKSKK